jgi:hypothetical protein
MFSKKLFIPLFVHFVAYSDGSFGPVGVYTREDCEVIIERKKLTSYHTLTKRS